MSAYTAPLQDMHFVLNELAGLEQISALPGCEEATAETVTAVLHEAGKFSSGVLAPLNRPGDVAGCRWEDGDVKTPAGFVEAYQQFVEGGWNGLNFPCEFGGQGLPKLVASPVLEMVMSANLGFSLCPLLTGGAIEALLLRGTPEQKATYLHRMVEGSWTGTMNLTEPQAGSDLGLIRSKAVPDGDHYRIYGQKIFITHGEHDMAENIIHLVLARLPDAPEGVKGISLFVVPKFLVNPDGSLGARNDVRCVSIEHKLGIHASPTAVLSYGDREGAIGYLVGEENRGVEYMFVMMNEARYTVGLQGVAVSERAYQLARSYAADRVQSKDLADPRGPSVAIIHHPDVRRMLMTMRALAEATRAVAYVVGAAIDQAHLAPDDAARQEARAFVDYMIPIHKGWATEASIEVANLGIQVHGGMGFIEETGAAQYLRDARITTIYEGTTGIQANDLIGRKLAREGGTTMAALLTEVTADAQRLVESDDAGLATIGQSLQGGLQALQRAVDWLLTVSAARPAEAAAGAVPFLKLAGTVLGGWLLSRGAEAAVAQRAAGSAETDFLNAKVLTCRHFMAHVMVDAASLSRTVLHGADTTLALADHQF